jgi:mannose-6-phosphate isomerase-like protein (cupin superfamily)
MVQSGDGGHAPSEHGGVTDFMQPFFEAAAAHQTIELAALGISTRVLLSAAATGGKLVLFEETTAPGAGPPLHVHHRQAEFFRVVAGDYAFVIGDQTFLAGPDDTVFVPVGMPHAFCNRGSSPGRLLFGLTPAAEGEAFFTELARFLRADAPPDVAAINEAFAGRFEIVGPPLATSAGGQP